MTQFFADHSVWNYPLPADAPVDANSANLIAELESQVAVACGINFDSWTTAIFEATNETPESVNICNSVPAAMVTAFGAVPIPAGVYPNQENDGHMVIYQPSTDKMWEFFEAHEAADCAYGNEAIPGWHMRFGGAIDNVTRDSGSFDPYSWPGANKNWGATATSLPLVGGMVTCAEGTALDIPHAICVTTIDSHDTDYRWPAKRTDGNQTGSDQLEEGMMFRLPAGYDVSGIPTPIMRAVATAIRDYGLIIRDRGGAVGIYFEDVQPGDEDVWVQGGTTGSPGPGALLTTFTDVLMESLPWEDMQVVATSYRPPPPPLTIHREPSLIAGARPRSVKSGTFAVRPGALA